MKIDRRRLLTMTAGIATASVIGAQRVADTDTDSAEVGMRTNLYHPLTGSLLNRAARIGQYRDRPDPDAIERAIRARASTLGLAEPPVIKWMETPAEAFDHLSGLGLDALMDMGTSSFWRSPDARLPIDDESFDRAFEVRMLAGELVGVEEHVQGLMGPKVIAKSKALSTGLSAKDTFRIRAVSAQIGWLETSLTDAAA